MGIKELIAKVLHKTKGVQTMTATEQKQDKSYVTYVYGQIYRGYIESKKKRKFKITNIHVREWRKILGWLKKNEYIVDFKLGDTIETACELEIKGFNSKNLLYKKYLEGIDKNMAKENGAA